MTQPSKIECPNCGAGLGPEKGGEYECGYCHHRSKVITSESNEQKRLSALTEALGRFAEQRAKNAREIAQRQRDATESARSANGWLMLILGGIFLAIGVVCFVLGAGSMISSKKLHGSAGIYAFGLFWLISGGVLFSIGLRYHRAIRREKLLRAQGVAGKATVISYQMLPVYLDGNQRVSMVLRVEIPGQPPRMVKFSEFALRSDCIVTGAELPVFVNPKKTDDLLVDWWAA